jgi:Domain of unknown function (DUF5666)
MTSHTLLRARRRLPAALGAALLLLTLSACGGSSTATTSSPEGQGQGQGQGQSPGRGDGSFGGVPGASGKIAAITGHTLQVQNDQSGQVAVTYTGKTAVTEQVSTSASALSVGDCVMVGSSAQSPSATVAASSVRITSASHGSCTGGRVGGFRPGQSRVPSSGGSGFPSGRPSGAPSGAPSGGFRGGFGGGAFGQVTAVTSGGFTVKSSGFGPQGSSKTSDVSVTFSSSTRWTTTKKTSSASLAVGKCVTAIGNPDDTGAVTARSISVSPAVNGSCMSGFGQRPTQGQES